MNLTAVNDAIPVPTWFRVFMDEAACDFAYDFNANSVLRLRDDIDLERFAAALTAALRAQEVTRVQVEEPKPGEWVMRDSGVPFPEIRVERLPAGSFDEVRRNIVRPFSFPGKTYCRVRLALIGDEPWVFMCRHHAFCDNVSHQINLSETIRAYMEPGWIPPPDGYFEWARKEHEASVGPRGEEGRCFWTERAARFADWPRSPRQDRNGSIDVTGEPNRFFFELPWSGGHLAKASAVLGSSFNVLSTGAFLRAVAADHGADRAVVGWTCRGRNASTRRIGGAFLRDYDVGVEIGGDVRTFLRRVRFDLNHGMRHPYGFSHGLVWTADGGCENDLSVINIYGANDRSAVFAPDPQSFDAGSPSDCTDLFELVLLQKADGVPLSECFVRYMPDYYSRERVADFMRLFVDELAVFLREAKGGVCA